MRIKLIKNVQQNFIFRDNEGIERVSMHYAKIGEYYFGKLIGNPVEGKVEVIINNIKIVFYIDEYVKMYTGFADKRPKVNSP